MNSDANWQTAAMQMQEAFKGMVQQTSSVPSNPIQFDAAKLQQI